MCQLLRQGYIAALAPVGVPNCDIVVTDDIGDRLCALQVKTRRNLGSDGGWHMSKKHEPLRSPTLVYCFVDFGKSPSDAPTTFVVPACVVGETLQAAHQAWLHQPGRGPNSPSKSVFLIDRCLFAPARGRSKRLKIPLQVYFVRCAHEGL